jgi:hypothetical protein
MAAVDAGDPGAVGNNRLRGNLQPLGGGSAVDSGEHGHGEQLHIAADGRRWSSGHGLRATNIVVPEWLTPPASSGGSARSLGMTKSYRSRFMEVEATGQGSALEWGILTTVR